MEKQIHGLVVWVPLPPTHSRVVVCLGRFRRIGLGSRRD